MIKHSTFARFFALSTSVIAAGALAIVVPTTVHADTQTHATVSFSMPKDATVSIKAMPDIDFGSEQIATTATDIAAKTVSAPVEVSNPGFQNGWTLTVAASDFANTENTRTIKGAELTFAHTAVAATDDTNISKAPTTSESGTVIEAGSDAALLISAAKGAGIGTYQANYAPNAVSLHVPAGNVSSDYQADLDWTMTNSAE